MKVDPRQKLYIPTKPDMEVVEIIPHSGNPMQSAAKVPILVAFKCRRTTLEKSAPNYDSDPFMVRPSLNMTLGDARAALSPESKALMVAAQSHGSMENLRLTAEDSQVHAPAVRAGRAASIIDMPSLDNDADAVSDRSSSAVHLTQQNSFTNDAEMDAEVQAERATEDAMDKSLVCPRFILRA